MWKKAKPFDVGKFFLRTGKFPGYSTPRRVQAELLGSTAARVERSPGHFEQRTAQYNFAPRPLRQADQGEIQRTAIDQVSYTANRDMKHKRTKLNFTS